MRVTSPILQATYSFLFINVLPRIHHKGRNLGIILVFSLFALHIFDSHMSKHPFPFHLAYTLVRLMWYHTLTGWLQGSPSNIFVLQSLLLMLSNRLLKWHAFHSHHSHLTCMLKILISGIQIPGPFFLPGPYWLLFSALVRQCQPKEFISSPL